MRRARALAALAFALAALGAAACKPSSLTPFGIGTRGLDDASGNINGSWAGVNSTGGSVAFNVGSETLADLKIDHVAPRCTRPFELVTGVEPIVDGEFTLEMFGTQGRVVVNGTFTSATTCSGTYFFEGLSTSGPCPTKGAGSFVAAKTN